MLATYMQDWKRAKRVNNRGTTRRRAGLESFIYYFGRYLIPVLERSPRKYYQKTVEFAIEDVIMEYAAYESEIDSYCVEETLAILKSGEELGLRPPPGLRSKCERVVAGLEMTVEAFLEGFAVPWDQKLVSILQNSFKDRPFSDATQYDPLMMSISKLIEDTLGGYLRSSGIEETHKGASDLLSIAVERYWLKRAGAREPHPIYYLLKWYFSEIRNEPHHKFVSYNYEEIRDAILITNYVLQQLNSFATRT
jgi:hypothetical protein